MPKRRAKGDGSITPHPGGGFRAFAPAHGGSPRASKVCATRAEAQAWLRARLGEPPAGRGTFGDYLAGWLARREGVKAAATVRGDRQTAAKHLAPALGRVALSALSKRHCEAWLSSMRGESADARHRAARLLRSVLNGAVADDALPRSPFDRLRVPPPPEPHARALTAAELGRLVAAADTLPWGTGAAVRLGADAGLRPSELLALAREDFDPAAGTIRCRRSLCQVGRKFKEPKTRAGRRTLPVSRPTALAIAAHLAAVAGGPDAPLFASAEGAFWWLSNWQDRAFDPACRAAGVEATPYTLRHTCATLLLRAGVGVKVVSERLGHKDVVMTLRVYAHCLPDDQVRAADAMGAYLSAGPGTTPPG